MHKLFLIIAVLMLCVSGCISSNSENNRVSYNLNGIDKIAIVEVTGQIVDVDATTQIADLFTVELLHKGYSPIPLLQSTSKIQSILDLEPINLQPGAYSQMGQMLKVPAVLVINVPYIDSDEISISAQLIDSKDGSVLWMDQDFGSLSAMATAKETKGRTQEDYLMDPLLMFQQPKQVVEEPQITMAIPGERPLNPQELQKAEDIVANICSSLPTAKIYSPTITPATPAPMAIPEPKPRSKPKTTPRDW